MTPPDPPSNGSLPGLSPLIPGRSGRPTYSLEALRERVERQFLEETAGRDDILADLDTEAKQRELLGEIADYICAVESITLDGHTRAALIDGAYRSLFTFGPLEPFLADEAITEIAVDGATTIAVRRGLGRLERVEARFDDPLHLDRVAERILAAGESTPQKSALFVERGVTLRGRPARVTAVAPPLSAALSLQIRLHPREPLTLDALCTRYGALPAEALTLLNGIVQAGHGLLIAGEAGTGKTTLAAALAALIPPGAGLVAVERAAELPLPDTATRQTVAPAQPFAEMLLAALDRDPDWLLVDELRGDEGPALWDVLSRPAQTRGIWLARGSAQPERLRSALTMLVRRDHPGLPQLAIDAAWAAHFPFIAALKATPDGARLAYLAETRLVDETLRIVPLIEYQGGTWQKSGARPQHTLDLPPAGEVPGG